MLVMTRRIGSKLYIGDGADQVTLTVLDVAGHGVRLGIEAPRHVEVRREEMAAGAKAGQQVEAKS